MNISTFAVRRPIMSIMAALIIIIIGLISLWRLSIDLMPDITYPTLSISTVYRNASPEEIEELITRPLEEAVSAVPGVERVTSFSSEGQSSVRVTFTWGTHLDEAANDLRDRLDRVISLLPEDAERPVLRKFDLASYPILILGASSNLDPIALRAIIDNQIKHRIERVPGVASLDIRGGLEREIHVNLDPQKIKALDIAADQILQRIRAENINLPAGTIQQGLLDITIRTPGVYTHLDELRNMVVAMRDGVPVRLREIAAVQDRWEKVTRIIRVNGEPGMRLAVNKQSGKNTVEVAQGVLKEIERINREIPQLKITPIIDTSDYIKRAISNVARSILYGGFLAVFVLFMFLRNIASTAIIFTTIPISIVATFALMYSGGFTLNIMTLGGLALGIGMLVDNAIVVLENIFRLRQQGLGAKAAAIQGSQEVRAAVIASTITTLAVFLPLVFAQGMSGLIFKQLAYVVGFALICSLTVALTLVPMLASRMRAPAAAANPSAPAPGDSTMAGYAQGFYLGLENRYRRLLRWTLAHRFTTLSGAFVLLAGCLTLIPMVGVELMPATDESEVRVSAEMAVGTRLDVVDRTFEQIEAIVYETVPEIQNTVSFIGGSPWRARGGNAGEMRIALVPVNQRNRSSEEIAHDLRRHLSDLPGVRIRTRAGQGLFILRMGVQGDDRIQVDVRGHDLQIANALAHQVQAVIAAVEGITDTRVSRETGTPEELILVDRVKAADMQLTVSQIATMLQTVLSGSSAGTFREAGNEYTIRVQLDGAETRSLDEILDLPITNAAGQRVVLRNVVTTAAHLGPVFIERKDQQRVIYVTAEYSGRDMGAILADVRNGLDAIVVPLEFSLQLSGDYEEQQKSFNELQLSFFLALLLVYMVMASLYESLRDPLVVMFSVPFAAIGVILMLFMSGTTFNVQSYIGCIMLGGIVVNNAILLVDHMNLLRRRDGLCLTEAIEEAGRRRLRPILMTATTTMLAMTPLALGVGEGSEAQAPMARAIVGGLFSSTFITLIVVPTVYSLITRKHLYPDEALDSASEAHASGTALPKETT
jgi:hydrophobic/amphiphilic exporter-1 (mainly G- bacteria), HAE1 family